MSVATRTGDSLRRVAAHMPFLGPARPKPAGPPRVAGSLLRLSLALAIGYGALAGGLVYWQVVEAQKLTTDPGNPPETPPGVNEYPASASAPVKLTFETVTALNSSPAP